MQWSGKYFQRFYVWEEKAVSAVIICMNGSKTGLNDTHFLKQKKYFNKIFEFVSQNFDFWVIFTLVYLINSNFSLHN